MKNQPKEKRLKRKINRKENQPKEKQIKRKINRKKKGERTKPEEKKPGEGPGENGPGKKKGPKEGYLSASRWAGRQGARGTIPSRPKGQSDKDTPGRP
jgi:hypothetical protein